MCDLLHSPIHIPDLIYQMNSFQGILIQTPLCTRCLLFQSIAAGSDDLGMCQRPVEHQEVLQRDDFFETQWRQGVLNSYRPTARVPCIMFAFFRRSSTSRAQCQFYANHSLNHCKCNSLNTFSRPMRSFVNFFHVRLEWQFVKTRLNHAL